MGRGSSAQCKVSRSFVVNVLTEFSKKKKAPLEHTGFWNRRAELSREARILSSEVTYGGSVYTGTAGSRFPWPMSPSQESTRHGNNSHH